MPFVNEAQRRACYAQLIRDLKAGIIPRWNCHKFARHKSPKRKSPKRKSKK